MKRFPTNENTSMRLNITKRRVQLINEKTEEQQYFVIRDLIKGKPEGTRVQFKINCKQLNKVHN